jgi:outer membrane protein OmpA-like peptidoglycan-associated protein
LNRRPESQTYNVRFTQRLLFPQPWNSPKDLISRREKSNSRRPAVIEQDRGVLQRMTGTIVNDLNGLFRSQALGEAASQLGESESSVMRGFEAASSAIMAALTTHLGQSGFMKQAYDLITSPLNDGGILSNLGGYFSRDRDALQSDGLGGRMLSLLFGGNQSTVAEGISETSGVRVSSASALMAAAAPMVLGVLGRRVKESHLDVSGLSTMLQNEGPAHAELARESAAHGAAGRTDRWLGALLLAALGIVGLFWMLNHGRRVVNEASYAARSTAPNLGDFVQQTLPSGATLSVPRYGVESRLLDFMQNASAPVDHAWVDFDRLSFEPNSAALRPESTEQIANIAKILKAYPTTRLMIGGFTDDTGDATVDMQLSQARADSVKQELIKMGVGGNRLEAQGFGATAPIADNSTQAGRFKNRRIALRLTAR